MNKYDMMLVLCIHRFRVPLLETAFPVNSEGGRSKASKSLYQEIDREWGGKRREDYI